MTKSADDSAKSRHEAVSGQVRLLGLRVWTAAAIELPMGYSEYIRDRILRAAEAEFLEQGFHGASLNRILRSIGGSKATIFRKFQSKESLFAVVVERFTSDMIAEFEARAVPSDDIREDLSRFAIVLLRSMLSERALFLVRTVIAEGARFPAVRASFARIGVLPMMAKLELRMAHWAQVGAIVSADYRRDAEQFIGMVSSGWLNQSLLGIGAERNAANIEAHVANAVNIFLEGRLPR